MTYPDIMRRPRYLPPRPPGNGASLMAWINRKINHIAASLLIKDPDWHLLLCDCKEPKNGAA